MIIESEGEGGREILGMAFQTCKKGVLKRVV